ncbi:hypothetical protein B0O99DRAFT_619036 [Bisporella sp. PMI_857]|nr:hypothetical protein B0O99DRAFT_619036 [Bisporella sp. PMI_857]
MVVQDSLQIHYPWTTSPLIASAPMRLISTAPLALAVSQAGGFGFLGAGTDSSTLQSLLNSVNESLFSSSPLETHHDTLPVGVGFICWGTDLHSALQALKSQSRKPAAAWLFAPNSNSELVAWAEGIREATDGKTKIWVQVGSVKDALEAVRMCKPHVLVIQGNDAGGHGLAQSASLITLLPECRDALAEAGLSDDLVLIATGGIMNGQGAAAALVLGADGVCLGTRFLASPEAAISNGYRQDVVSAKDGGVSTGRTKVYDTLRGTTGWPEIYNGRAVLNHSFWDHENGMTEEENKRRYEEALKLGDDGWGENGRLTAYAGAGVGLVKKVMPARDIVLELQEGVRLALDKTRSIF